MASSLLGFENGIVEMVVEEHKDVHCMFDDIQLGKVMVN